MGTCTSWAHETVRGLEFESAFAVDPQGKPWVVYRWAQPGPLHRLAVAWRTGASAWTSEQLPVGAFDANGKPLVLAWDDLQARLYRRQ